MKLLTGIFALLLLAVAATPLFSGPRDADPSPCPYVRNLQETADGMCTAGGAETQACPYLREEAAREEGRCPYSGEQTRPAANLRAL
jgi:hypothetical protein